MPKQIELSEALDMIMDAIVKELQDSILIPHEATIIRGDRARGKPPTPCIWAFQETAVMSQSPTTIAERWDLPLSLVAVVKNADPEMGYKEATNLAAKARTVILKSQSLGLREFVQHIRSIDFNPSGPYFNEGQSFGASARIMITFSIIDR